MSIKVTNLQYGAELCYSHPLLVGEVRPPLAQGIITVQSHQGAPIDQSQQGAPPAQPFQRPQSKQSQQDGPLNDSQLGAPLDQSHLKAPLSWPVFNGIFKAVVPLTPGSNTILLTYYQETVKFVLHYRVPEIRHFVRPVLIRCVDGNGTIQGPDDEDCSMEATRERISIGAQLLQTFTAEKLQEHGLGRKTFLLEKDLDPAAPECHIFKSKLREEEAQAMSGSDLWMHFARELMAAKQFTVHDRCKWFAFMSFTRYQPLNGQVPKSHSDVLRSTKGHTALGGGGLALFGSGTMHCWARDLAEVASRFTDSRKMDRTQFMDDSAYREFLWANYSTGLGASLHELGHTFDLAHTPTGVMARGFDDLYRVFTVQPLWPRGSHSSDSSRTASPIPYSPKQSPIRRPQARDGSPSRSGSPKPCPLSKPRVRIPSGDGPSVIQIETAFKKLHTQTSQTLTIKNYDGSETRRTVVRHRDGTETVSEVTTHNNGDKVVKETVKHIASGKTRTTMSMSACTPQTDVSLTNGTTHTPSSLPSSPNGANRSLAFQELRYRDGGAHFYRSSAVLLQYHKWFNPLRSDGTDSPPHLEGSLLRSACGLRLIELRSIPDGVVFHHWEFLHRNPPRHFRLKYAETWELSRGIMDVSILAEDDHGNIFKKKISLDQLKDGKENSTER